MARQPRQPDPIAPVIGMDVHFYENASAPNPQAAKICAITDGGCNLAVWASSGFQYARGPVPSVYDITDDGPAYRIPADTVLPDPLSDEVTLETTFPGVTGSVMYGFTVR